MVHGEEKARDMARSLLPSTRRKGARWTRATIHRAHRRHFREELRRLVGEPDDVEDRADLEDEPVTEVRQMVRVRRFGDKLAPFLRWATAHARPVPRESRMSHIRALVPRGLIGDHALEHLQRETLFTSAAELVIQRAREASYPRPDLRMMNRGEQAEWLRALLESPEGHRVFNQWLKACHLVQHRERSRVRPCTCVPRRRLLLGAHDVRPFLAAIWERKHAERLIFLDGPRDAVNTFLSTLKQHRGDVEATARALGLAPRLPR